MVELIAHIVDDPGRTRRAVLIIASVLTVVAALVGCLALLAALIPMSPEAAVGAVGGTVASATVGLLIRKGRGGKA